MLKFHFILKFDLVVGLKSIMNLFNQSSLASTWGDWESSVLCFYEGKKTFGFDLPDVDETSILFFYLLEPAIDLNFHL